MAWFAYNCCRFYLGGVRGFTTLSDFLTGHMILLGQVVLPLLMMGVYYLSGYYNEVFRKSRLSELMTTIKSTLINSAIVFFIALINDMMTDNRSYNYEILVVLVGLLFVFTYTGRLIITSITSRKIKRRIWRFHTLVVGAGAAAFAFVEKMNKMRQSNGYHVVGYVEVPGENRVKDIDLPVYTFDEIADVIRREQVKEFIVVPTNQNIKMLLNTINHLYVHDLPIKVTPERFNMLFITCRIRGKWKLLWRRNVLPEARVSSCGNPYPSRCPWERDVYAREALPYRARRRLPSCSRLRP